MPMPLAPVVKSSRGMAARLAASMGRRCGGVPPASGGDGGGAGGVTVDQVLRAAAGEREAEAVDGLEAAAVVDGDGGVGLGDRGVKGKGLLAGEESGLIGSGEPDVDGARFWIARS